VKKGVTNFAASARARLLDLTRRRRGDFQLTLQHYAAERFLYRLGASRHRDRFVLKGAMLFVLWHEVPPRPTRDLDLAGYGYSSGDAGPLEADVREILSLACPRDGIDFELDTLQLAPIRGLAEDHGFRVNLHAFLDGARIPFQVDIGFGDPVVPEPVEADYPELLDVGAPRVRVYPRETVVAEKLHAMAFHGVANTRYKDFFDVWLLAARFTFEGQTLAAAIATTFARRASASLEPWPVALATSFYEDEARAGQWLRFLRTLHLEGESIGFRQVGEEVIVFLARPVRAVAAGEELRETWQPGGPWR
jgi:hypothetical protein